MAKNDRTRTKTAISILDEILEDEKGAEFVYIQPKERKENKYIQLALPFK